MSNDLCPRRRFLQVVAGGGVLAGVASLGVGCGGGLSGTYSGGDLSSYAVGSLTALSSAPLAVGRDAQGVYAMTLICTHAGCEMNSQGSVSEQGVACFCHGSEYDANGNVLRGPASSPLEHFQVTISASGAISIDADVSVAEGTRTPVTTG
jgi:cytochrome b6-f complex iron-sulfur subunit